jgi:hypothetical protein
MRSADLPAVCAGMSEETILEDDIPEEAKSPEALFKMQDAFRSLSAGRDENYRISR